MSDRSSMAGDNPPLSRWALLRASFARRDDPYAGADVAAARRLVPMLVLLNALLTAAFLPMAPPDEAIGGAGWALAAAIIVGQLVTVRRLAQPEHEASWNELLAVAYAGVVCVALLEWLAGGHSPYMMLFLLWVGAGVGVHPPR